MCLCSCHIYIFSVCLCLMTVQILIAVVIPIESILIFLWFYVRFLCCLQMRIDICFFVCLREAICDCTTLYHRSLGARTVQTYIAVLTLPDSRQSPYTYVRMMFLYDRSLGNTINIGISFDINIYFTYTKKLAF